MGLPSLKIHFGTNFHPSLDCYSPIDDSDLFFFCEGLTFTDPIVVLRAPVIFFIRSFMIINVKLAGFGVLLLLVGWFILSRLIWTILGDVTLFVRGETVSFFAQLFHNFWSGGANPSFGSAILICRSVLSAHVSIVSGWGNSILTFKILAKSSAENLANYFWGAFLDISPWMSLMFWTA